MVKQNLFLFSFSFFFLLFQLSGSVSGFRPEILFVFGDSYAGKPDGHYSDGRVQTEFLSYYLAMRKNEQELPRFEMNFAYAGTGVFNTSDLGPNMTSQIDFFQNLLHKLACDKSELDSSFSLVTVAGNDYCTYIAEGGSYQGFPSFIARVISQTAVNLKRIHELGVRKVAVAALEPIGCLPQETYMNSSQECNQTMNALVKLHNSLLQQAVAKLNSESNDSGAFIILDLYDAFYSVLNQTETTTKFGSPILRPCCFCKSIGYDFGSVDAKGEKMYTLCDNPKATFFWDSFHPTNAGWSAVFSYLKSKFEES